MFVVHILVPFFSTVANPCSPNPCKNSGTCKEMNGVATCECPAQFEGNFCDGAYFKQPFQYNLSSKLLNKMAKNDIFLSTSCMIVRYIPSILWQNIIVRHFSQRTIHRLTAASSYSVQGFFFQIQVTWKGNFTGAVANRRCHKQLLMK